ncbi:hypothetical protein DFH09DRAFT_1172496 [Mycena vulgaris]|nr:hypothetical protein DFH09DRAFT_1172496 [Mycena vulgaris]
MDGYSLSPYSPPDPAEGMTRTSGNAQSSDEAFTINVDDSDCNDTTSYGEQHLDVRGQNDHDPHNSPYGIGIRANSCGSERRISANLFRRRVQSDSASFPAMAPPGYHGSADASAVEDDFSSASDLPPFSTPHTEQASSHWPPGGHPHHSYHTPPSAIPHTQQTYIQGPPGDHPHPFSQSSIHHTQQTDTQWPARDRLYPFSPTPSSPQPDTQWTSGRHPSHIQTTLSLPPAHSSHLSPGWRSEAGSDTSSNRSLSLSPSPSFARTPPFSPEAASFIPVAYRDGSPNPYPYNESKSRDGGGYASGGWPPYGHEGHHPVDSSVSDVDNLTPSLELANLSLGQAEILTGNSSHSLLQPEYAPQASALQTDTLHHRPSFLSSGTHTSSSSSSPSPNYHLPTSLAQLRFDVEHDFEADRFRGEYLVSSSTAISRGGDTGQLQVHPYPLPDWADGNLTSWLPQGGLINQSDGGDNPFSTRGHIDSQDDQSSQAASVHLSSEFRAAVGTDATRRAATRRRKDPNKRGPFVCKICGNDFTAKHNLKNHTNSHNSVKEHPCPKCHQFFGTSHVRDRHKLKCVGPEIGRNTQLDQGRYTGLRRRKRGIVLSI